MTVLDPISGKQVTIERSGQSDRPAAAQGLAASGAQRIHAAKNSISAEAPTQRSSVSARLKNSD